MTQVAFNGTALGTGSLFSFFEEADKALKSYLENASHTGRLKVLRDHLVSDNSATVRAHVPRSETEYDESTSNFPLIYIMSWSWEIDDFESANLNLSVDTEVRVWTANADLAAAGKLCVDVTGTIGSMIAQTLAAGAGQASTDWGSFYANVEIVNLPRASRVTYEKGHALQILTFTWRHRESY